MIYKRIENNDKKWWEVLDAVQLTYNRKMEHSVTKMTPHEARQNNNQQPVKFNLELKRRHSRQYPEISVGDTVRVFKKNKARQGASVELFAKKI